MLFTKVMLHLKNMLFLLLYVVCWFYALAFDKPEGWFLVYFLSTVLIFGLLLIFPTLKPWEIQLIQSADELFIDRLPFNLRFKLTKTATNYWCYPFLKVGIDFAGTDEGFEETIYPVFKKEEAICFQKVTLKRGCYQQNTLLLEAGDPFGLIVKHKKLTLQQPILVYPAYLMSVKEQLMKEMALLKPSLFQKNEWSQFQLKSIRTYQPGDPFHHIDWKTSSKQQVLYTKEYEQEKKQQSYALFFYGIDHPDFESLLAACCSIYHEIQSVKKVSLYLVGQFDHEKAISRQHEGFARIQPFSDGSQSNTLLKDLVIQNQQLLIFTATFTPELKEFILQYSGKESLFIILSDKKALPAFTALEVNVHIITTDLMTSSQKNK